MCWHHLAAYNKISAAYFTLVRLVFRMRLPLLPITIASLPSTQKHFDWAVSVTLKKLDHKPFILGLSAPPVEL